MIVTDAGDSWFGDNVSSSTLWDALVQCFIKFHDERWQQDLSVYLSVSGCTAERIYHMFTGIGYLSGFQNVIKAHVTVDAESLSNGS
jgi:hypothetical protein